MSEIPFVNALGDALEAATVAASERPVTRRRYPRRLVAVAVAGLMLVGGGLAVARFLDSPEKLASRSVGCYDGPSLDANVAVPGGVGSPREVCAGVYRSEGRAVPPLVACDWDGAVAVFPGRGADVCRRLGLAPLPRGYGAARARVARLQRDILALERTADCIPPAALARRVQALLHRTGWTGWRAWLRADAHGSPCATVSELGGDSGRSIAGALDADSRRVIVVGAPYRSTTRLMYGEPGHPGLAPQLEDASGARCFTLDALRAEVARRLASTGRAVSFTVTTGRPAGVTFEEARERRYQAGCAVVTDLTAARDGRGLVVALLRRG